MKTEIAKLKRRVYTAQFSFWIEQEVRDRLTVLKEKHGVDTIEEIRKAIRERLSVLESALS
jgi:hypothetical protein